MHTINDSLQQTFSKDYVYSLKKSVKNGNIEAYSNDTFEVEDPSKNIYKMPGIMGRKVVLDASKSDYENAIAFYEAYKDISPLIASQESFWVYLTHVEYFEYVKKRWFGQEEMSVSTIQKRFLMSSKWDNALYRLWWSVYLTKDESLENPYVYTEVILRAKNSDLLQNFSKSKLYRLASASHGILKFFSEYESRKKFSEVNRHIIQYFNRLSGVKKLVYMNEDFFYETAKTALTFYNLKNATVID
ncbi:MAG: hypothetical protein KBT28_11905 [Bacteroidales bacterium]|nr:hypothetical protein [Candidatus Colimorpha merdihippi]